MIEFLRELSACWKVCVHLHLMRHGAVLVVTHGPWKILCLQFFVRQTIGVMVIDEVIGGQKV